MVDLVNLKHLRNDFERAEYLQNILISHATDSSADPAEYRDLRSYFLSHTEYEDLLPSFVRTKRDLFQFWSFIKYKFATWAERREFIWQSFSGLLDLLEKETRESMSRSTAIVSIKKFGINSVYLEMQRALERVNKDPEGGITLARTVLESVCKFILDEKESPYADQEDLSLLYKSTAKELNLSPDQHTEEVFKQILGGCSGIVNGLGTLRNKLGDAHGKGAKKTKPAARHAKLAVNLSCSMAVFLIETHEAAKMIF